VTEQTSGFHHTLRVGNSKLSFFVRSLKKAGGGHEDRGEREAYDAKTLIAKSLGRKVGK